MSHEVLEERVGKLEVEQARQGLELRHVSQELRGVADGVKTLLERDARRPEALSFKTVTMTCTGLAACAVVVWWLIETAPVVRQMQSDLAYMRWQYGWTGKVER
ncbi:MAG: hypothetical protein ACRCS9_08715 [Hyphomicrobium sp.]